MNTQTIEQKSGIPIEKLMEELRTMVADAEELLVSTSNQTGEGVAATRARIMKSLHIVKSRLVSAENEIVEQTRIAAKATDQYVHDNPWKAIGISVCAGVLVGMLVAKR